VFSAPAVRNCSRARRKSTASSASLTMVAVTSVLNRWPAR